VGGEAKSLSLSLALSLTHAHTHKQRERERERERESPLSVPFPSQDRWVSGIGAAAGVNSFFIIPNFFSQLRELTSFH
jgi:hypothetical protein